MNNGHRHRRRWPQPIKNCCQSVASVPRHVPDAHLENTASVVAKPYEEPCRNLWERRSPWNHNNQWSAATMGSSQHTHIGTGPETSAAPAIRRGAKRKAAGGVGCETCERSHCNGPTRRPGVDGGGHQPESCESLSPMPLRPCAPWGEKLNTRQRHRLAAMAVGPGNKHT